MPAFFPTITIVYHYVLVCVFLLSIGLLSCKTTVHLLPLPLPLSLKLTTTSPHLCPRLLVMTADLHFIIPVLLALHSALHPSHFPICSVLNLHSSHLHHLHFFTYWYINKYLNLITSLWHSELISNSPHSSALLCIVSL